MKQESADVKDKSNTTKKIFSICFLGLMLVLFLASIFAYINIHGLAESSDNTSNTGITVTESFAQLYPFADQEESTQQDNDSSIEKYEEIVKWITNGTEGYLTSLNPFYNTLASINNVLSYSFGEELVLNGNNAFVKLDNGYTAGCCTYCPSPESLEYIADFSTWIDNQDIPLVALVQPDKSDDSITVFPEGVPHGFTKMNDEYKATLDENGIKYIDAKNVLLAENEDFYSWFYKTDYHWNVHAAFKMAGETASVLNDEHAISTDTTTLNDGNYQLEVYPNSFLEDMEIYYPRKDTSFHVEIPSEGIDKTGSFDDTLIDQDFLQFGNNKYAAFLYGDKPLIRIENNKSKNGTRVLVIKESFGDALCPYLADTVQYLDVIDPRHFDGSIRSFITQTKPDAVILCIGVPTEGDEEFLQLK